MMTDLILYTNPQSRGRTVRWVLEECGAEYSTHYLGYNDTIKSPEYLKINPMGKVPALIHQGNIITETAAICTYLADIFPNANLVPQNRAEYYRWLFFVAGPVEQAFTDKMMGFEVSREMQKPVGYGSFQQVLQTLDNWLSDKKYIAGDQFTAVDCLAVAGISFAKFKGLIPSDMFDAYCKPHLQRLALLKAMAIDDAAAKEMGL